MKILHLAHQYLPEFTGGTEIYTRQLSSHLLARGHEVAVFYRRPGIGLQKRVEQNGLNVWSAAAGAMNPANRFRATFKQETLHEQWITVLDSFQPELIHVQHLMGLPTSLMSAVRARAIPYLITFHDYWWSCANAQLYTNFDQTICAGPDNFVNCGRCTLSRGGADGLKMAAPLLRPLLSKRNQRLSEIVAQAESRVAPTPFVQQIYRQIGVQEHIEVVSHGIEPPDSSPESVPFNSPLQLIYLGSIAPQKGLHIAIAAVNQLPADSVSFTIYGGLDAFPDYVAELRAQATHPGIRFAGHLERELLWTRLAQAHLAIMPTQWYESYVLTIDEMFAAGIPVVGSRLGVLPDRIRNGVDGLLVEPANVQAWSDSLRRFLEEPDLLARLRSGIRPVRRIEQHVDEMEAIYKRIMST